MQQGLEVERSKIKIKRYKGVKARSYGSKNGEVTQQRTGTLMSQ